MSCGGEKKKKKQKQKQQMKRWINALQTRDTTVEDMSEIIWMRHLGASSTCAFYNKIRDGNQCFWDKTARGSKDAAKVELFASQMKSKWVS